MNRKSFPSTGPLRSVSALALIGLAVTLTGCNSLPDMPSLDTLANQPEKSWLGSSPLATSETFHRGYVVPDNALQQIPVGSSQEQVLVVMGTPSTISTISGDVYYYISQTAERKASFMPVKVVDQRVIAIYFDKKTRRVSRVADYGLQDGKVFDFISRATPTAGEEHNLLRQLFKIVGG